MKPTRPFNFTIIGMDKNGDLKVSVQLKRKSLRTLRVLYDSARRAGAGRILAFHLALRIVMTDVDKQTDS